MIFGGDKEPLKFDGLLCATYSAEGGGGGLLMQFGYIYGQ